MHNFILFFYNYFSQIHDHRLLPSNKSRSPFGGMSIIYLNIAEVWLRPCLVGRKFSIFCIQTF